MERFGRVNSQKSLMNEDNSLVLRCFELKWVHALALQVLEKETIDHFFEASKFALGAFRLSNWEPVNAIGAKSLVTLFTSQVFLWLLYASFAFYIWADTRFKIVGFDQIQRVIVVTVFSKNFSQSESVLSNIVIFISNTWRHLIRVSMPNQFLLRLIRVRKNPQKHLWFRWIGFTGLQKYLVFKRLAYVRKINGFKTIILRTLLENVIHFYN